MTELPQLFPPGHETRVTTPDGKVALVVSSLGEPVPRPVALRCATARGLLRIAGSTATDANAYAQKQLLDFSIQMFAGGILDHVVVMSGATRILDQAGHVVTSILELPTLIQGWNPTCTTMGSAPRVSETLSYQGEHSTFIPGDRVGGNTLAHPGIGLFWSVQVSASHIADWSGDLPAYFALMDLLRADGKATGLFVDGGGKVTAQEIRMAIERGHPVAVRSGSGRFADDLVQWHKGLRGLASDSGRQILQQWDDEHVDYQQVTVVTTPAEGRDWLRAIGLTSA